MNSDKNIEKWTLEADKYLDSLRYDGTCGKNILPSQLTFQDVYVKACRARDQEMQIFKSNSVIHDEDLIAEITSLKSQLAEKDAEIESLKLIRDNSISYDRFNALKIKSLDQEKELTRLRELVVDIDWISEGLYMDDWGAVNFKYPMARLEKKLKEIREALGAKE